MESWKKDMVEQLLHGNPLEFDKVVAIKEPFVPKKLYRYSSVNDNLLNGLVNSTVYLSRPVDFNDPYDTSFVMDTSSIYGLTTDEEISTFETRAGTVFTDEEKISLKQGKQFSEVILSRFADEDFDPRLPREELIKFGERFYNEHAQQLFKRLEEAIRNSVRICCFTTRYDNMPMWYHYADKHSGVCIEFSPEESHPLFNRLLFPVIYNDERFDATKYFKNITSTEPAPTLFNFYASIFKSKDWANEEEWRLVWVGGDIDESPFARVKINAVYLGRKISQENKSNVIKVCQIRHIPVYQVDLCDTNEYTLVPTEVI